MKMSSGHILLFFFTFFFHADSLYLGDYRRPNLRILEEIKNESLSVDGKNKKTNRAEEVQGAEEVKTQGIYINCVFNSGSGNQPNYDCKYSPDVKKHWEEKEGRLIGTFSTSFACANKRSVRDKMKSPQKEVNKETWKQLIRDKRNTVYRDDVEVAEASAKAEEASAEPEAASGEETPAEAEEAPTEETPAEAEGAPAEEAPSEAEEAPAENKENVVSEEKPEVTEGENKTGDSEVSTDSNVDTLDEDNNGPSQNVAEENEHDDNGLNEDKDKASLQGEKVEENNTADAEENEEQGNGIEEETKDDKDTTDPEVSVEEDGVEQEEEDEEVKDKKTKEKIPENDDNDDKMDDKVDTLELNDDKVVVDKNCTETDGTKCDIDSDYDAILVPIQEEIGEIVSEDEMPLFMDFILKLLHEAGDYLISLLIQILEQRLRERQIAIKFDRKVEMLSKSYGNDTGKAMEEMERKVHEQLGKSFQLKIVEFMKQLYDTWKL